MAVIAGAAAGVIDTALGATTASTGQSAGDSANTAPANGPLRPGLVPASLIPLFTGATDTSGCGLTPELLAAQSHPESGYQTDAISSAGAVGIMQFLPSTWATWSGLSPARSATSSFRRPGTRRGPGKAVMPACAGVRRSRRERRKAPNAEWSVGMPPRWVPSCS